MKCSEAVAMFASHFERMKAGLPETVLNTSECLRGRALTLLGHGMNGVVFQTRPISGRKQMAVKIVPLRDDSTIAAFRREVKWTKSNHTMVTVYESYIHDNHGVMVMDLWKGTLAMIGVASLTEPQVDRLVRQVEGLWADKLVHRDLNEHNVLFRDDGRGRSVTIADMGTVTKLVSSRDSETGALFDKSRTTIRGLYFRTWMKASQFTVAEMRATVIHDPRHLDRAFVYGILVNVGDQKKASILKRIGVPSPIG